MRLWCLHVDDCQISAEQPRSVVDDEAPTEDPDGDTAARSDIAIDSGIVALAGVDERDRNNALGGETSPRRLAVETRRTIEDVASELGESTVLAVPTPALAVTPAEGEFPSEVFKAVDAAFETSDREYRRAPVGWQLAVSLSTRGHPLASRVRSVTGADRPEAGERRLLAPDGSTAAIEAAALSARTKRHLDWRDADGSSEAGGDTRHSVDFAAASDAGLVASEERGGLLTPAGTLVRDLLREGLLGRLRAAGARPVAGATPAPAAEGGPFAARSALSAATLPVSLYATGEGGDLSGESGQSRTDALRLWTIADSSPAGWDAVETQVALLRRWLDASGLDFVATVTTTADAVSEARLESVAAAIDRVAVLERAADGPTLAVELAVTDESGRPLGTGRVRLRERDGADRVVVKATVDSIDRLAVASCPDETSDRRQFPTWLAPTQVRLVALDPDAHRPRCLEIADSLAAAGVRVDIDDRALAVGTRLQMAERSGVPYVAVVGDDELTAETLSVTDSAARRERVLTPAALAARVTGEVDGYPTAESYQARLLSERLFAPESGEQ